MTAGAFARAALRTRGSASTVAMPARECTRTLCAARKLFFISVYAGVRAEHHDFDSPERAAAAPGRTPGDPCHHDPRRLRRRRAHRTARGERHGALPRAPGVQGRRDL